MVITQISAPKDGQTEFKTILDLELRATQPFERISRTASGGFQLHVLRWDEFDNREDIKIVIEKNDVDVIIEMIAKGIL